MQHRTRLAVAVTHRKLPEFYMSGGLEAAVAGAAVTASRAGTRRGCRRVVLACVPGRLLGTVSRTHGGAAEV